MMTPLMYPTFSWSAGILSCTVSASGTVSALAAGCALDCGTCGALLTLLLLLLLPATPGATAGLPANPIPCWGTGTVGALGMNIPCAGRFGAAAGEGAAAAGAAAGLGIAALAKSAEAE